MSGSRGRIENTSSCPNPSDIRSKRQRRFSGLGQSARSRLALELHRSMLLALSLDRGWELRSVIGVDAGLVLGPADGDVEHVLARGPRLGGRVDEDAVG